MFIVYKLILLNVTLFNKNILNNHVYKVNEIFIRTTRIAVV